MASQELDVKPKNLKRWRQEVEKLEQACEEVDAKLKIKEDLLNVEENEREALFKKEEVFKTEIMTDDDNGTTMQLDDDAGDSQKQNKIHENEIKRERTQKATYVSKNDDSHHLLVEENSEVENNTKVEENAKVEENTEQGLFVSEADPSKESDGEKVLDTTKMDQVAKKKKMDQDSKKSKFVQKVKSPKTIRESAAERQRKRRLKVSGLDIESGSQEEYKACCQWCGIIFKARKKIRLSVNLNQHQKRRHPLELSERLGLKVERVACPNCHRSFTERSDFHRHLRHSHGPKNHVCKECGFATHLDRLLKVHRSKKHNSMEVELKPVPCSFCGKKISQIGNLQRHEDVMHRGVRFKCDQCGLGFKDKRGLRKHESKIHREK